MSGIPVSSAGNYVDTQGQMWICDEIDFERGVYVQRIGKRIMDGTESWTLSTNGAGHFTTWALSGLVKPVSSSAWQAPLACTAYKTVNADTLYSTSGAYYIAQNGDEVWISKTGYNSVDDFIAYLATTPMTVLYELDTPIETPLSESELAAYRAMATQNPTTTIYNDSNAWMEVEYADSRIDEIEEALNLPEIDKTLTINGAPADAKAVGDALANAKIYTDAEIAEWVGDRTVSTQISSAVSTKSDVGHTHDDRYYTEAEVDAVVETKANASDLTEHTGNKSNPHGVTLSQLGVTATATELNYVGGVTSNVQMQLNNKISQTDMESYINETFLGGAW